MNDEYEEIKASKLQSAHKGKRIQVRHNSEWHDVEQILIIRAGRGKSRRTAVCVYTANQRLWADGNQTVIIRVNEVTE